MKPRKQLEKDEGETLKEKTQYNPVKPSKS